MNSLALHLPDDVVQEIAERAARLIADRQEPASPYMTVQQAAEYMACRPQRIYDLVSARRLRKYKDGSRTLVRRADLDAHLENRAA